MRKHWSSLFRLAAATRAVFAGLRTHKLSRAANKLSSQQPNEAAFQPHPLSPPQTGTTCLWTYPWLHLAWRMLKTVQPTPPGGSCTWPVGGVLQISRPISTCVCLCMGLELNCTLGHGVWCFNSELSVIDLPIVPKRALLKSRLWMSFRDFRDSG